MNEVCLPTMGCDASDGHAAANPLNVVAARIVFTGDKETWWSTVADDERVRPNGAPDTPKGAPVGRRAILGLLGLGAVGVVTGHRIQDGLAQALAPIEEHDPTGLTTLIPLGDTFRFYSVTGSVPRPTAESYRLSVSGLVARPATYSLADLQALPQTSIVRDFQCVTGWHVPQVHWSGVPLSRLLDSAQPSTGADAVRFHSFDGTYTESLPLAVARRDDVLVALRMLGRPVTHDHGGPVRMYASEMYGYKSTKWLSGVELTHGEVPGYWENRGYDLNGFIKR
jgi:DMSO/TMAO reductase YedYZ molybdopterin-dependent catalytic subunit